ncbi:hypothetical protein EIP86_010142 [Pleurotus ostreatoroseus]|nr:hypothetical protein EIP86_010142 [Pleurotus ostreatoroseus]
MPGELLKKRKIAVLGSRSVGKSSLVIQYIENHFVESYYPTIESTFSKTISYNGVDYDCDIIDTAGQDEYTILNSKHAIGIHGYVLVYSVNSRKSFEMVQIVYDKIINFCGMNQIPCVIVGSKTDLPKRCVRSVFSRRRPAHQHSKSAWSVSAEDGQNLATQTHSAYIETSAKTNTNVGESSRSSAQASIPADAAKVFELCLGEIEKRLPSSKAEPQTSKCTIQ